MNLFGCVFALYKFQWIQLKSGSCHLERRGEYMHSFWIGIDTINCKKFGNLWLIHAASYFWSLKLDLFSFLNMLEGKTEPDVSTCCTFENSLAK